jgi:uronate dehydrogenase
VEARGRLLVTGASGRLGTAVRRGLGGQWPLLRLTDVRAIADPEPHAEVVTCDLADAAAVDRLLVGVDAVVHFAGYPREAPWPQILASNVVPVTNLWEAARKAGTRRIVFASSNHVVGFNDRADPADPRVRARPDSRYGVAHAFTENLASFYADKFGIAGFGIRVGSMCEQPTDARMLATWLSPGDLVRLVAVGLSAEYHFELVYGVSRNARGWWNNARAYALGYDPQDRSDRWIDELAGSTLADPLAERLQGGRYVVEEFTGSAARLDRAGP